MKRIVGECTDVDERGAVGIRLEPGLMTVKESFNVAGLLAISRNRRRSRWLPELAGYLGIPLDVLLNVDPSAHNLPDHIREIRGEAITKAARRRLDSHLARRKAKAEREALADVR